MTEKQVISWNEFGELAEKLAGKITGKYGSSIDIVIGMARGGIPLSMLVADRLRAELDFMRVKSYKEIDVRAEPKLIFDIRIDINNRTVLLIDDLSDKGDTFDFATKHLLQSYKPRHVLTACIFVKPWSKFAPDVYLEKTEKWIVYPWELHEFGVKGQES